MYSNITGLSLGVSVPFAATELVKQTTRQVDNRPLNFDVVDLFVNLFSRFLFIWQNQEKVGLRELETGGQNTLQDGKTSRMHFRKLNGFYRYHHFSYSIRKIH